MKLIQRIISAAVLLALLAGCAGQAASPTQPPMDASPAADGPDAAYIDQTLLLVELVEIEDEAVALAEAPVPAVSNVLKPTASGAKTKTNDQAVIDYSNIKDGYVMVKCASPSGKRLMVRVFGPSYEVNETKYTYNLAADTWTTFPLSDGNGSYKVVVYEHTGSGNKYASVLTVSFDVTLTDEFAPFLRPNQFVNYENAQDTIAKGAELTQGVTDPLDKVARIYDYVVNHLTYDKKKAASITSGETTSYLPVLDDVLASGKGICFDYAALMAAMLRSQDVPCKMVVGYAGKTYHAWLSVWTEESGWIDGAVFFDGSTWQRMDPTFISSGKNSESIQKYVGDGSNYTAMYLY